MTTGHAVRPTVAKADSTRHFHRWYHSTLAASTIVIAIVGFAPGLFNKSTRLGELTDLVIIHALLSTAWLVLFLAQSWLVATRRTRTHRRLGFAAVGLAALMLVTGYATVIEQTRRGYELSGDLNIQSDPALAAIFPLGDLVSFVFFLAAGLSHRNRPDVHKRLMTLATLGGMMPAALGHFVGHNLRTVPGVIIPLVAAVFFTPAIYDRWRFGRFHRVTLSGGAALFLWANTRAIVIGPSAGWHELMSWLAR